MQIVRWSPQQTRCRCVLRVSRSVQHVVRCGSSSFRSSGSGLRYQYLVLLSPSLQRCTPLLQLQSAFTRPRCLTTDFFPLTTKSFPPVILYLAEESWAIRVSSSTSTMTCVSPKTLRPTSQMCDILKSRCSTSHTSSPMLTSPRLGLDHIPVGKSS